MTGSGSLLIVGLGPGPGGLVAPEGARGAECATDIVGYQAYVARVPARAEQRRHVSDNRDEIDRARQALRLACEGSHVAVVSGGDPGVFAMAAAVFDAVEQGDPGWRDLDIRLLPGISAM